MTPSNDPRFKNLPVWAQKAIEHLEQRLNEEKRRADDAYALFNGGKESSMMMEGAPSVPKLYLPDNRQVRFNLDRPHQQYIEVGYRYSHGNTWDKSELTVRSNYEQLVVRPEVANTIVISTLRRE